MKTRHVSKFVDVFQRTCSYLLDTWKNKYQVHITSLSLHCAIYWHNHVYIFAGQGSSLLLKMLNCTFIIALFATLCHILYFDAAKFSIKLFSFVYILLFYVVRQWNEYEIVTETRAIKTTPALPSKMLICIKILVIEPSSDEIKYT